MDMKGGVCTRAASLVVHRLGINTHMESQARKHMGAPSGDSSVEKKRCLVITRT